MSLDSCTSAIPRGFFGHHVTAAAVYLLAGTEPRQVDFSRVQPSLRPLQRFLLCTEAAAACRGPPQAAAALLAQARSLLQEAEREELEESGAAAEDALLLQAGRLLVHSLSRLAAHAGSSPAGFADLVAGTAAGQGGGAQDDQEGLAGAGLQHQLLAREQVPAPLA